MTDPGYSVSKHGRQCTSKCFQKEAHTVDPYTLNFIRSQSYNYCHTSKYFDNVNLNFRYVDECVDEKTYDEDIRTHKPSLSLITPPYLFSATSALKLFYNINSYSDFINYLSADVLPSTKARIIDYSWIVYKSQFTVNDILINSIIDIASNLWIYNIVNILLSTDKEINKSPDRMFNDFDKTKKYVQDNLITHSSVFKILEKFLKKSDVINFISSLKYYYTDIIITNMQKMLKANYNL